MHGSRNFCQGGGGSGGPDLMARKQPERVFFVVLLVLSLLNFTVYRAGPMSLLQRKLYFSKDPEGVQLFPGEGDGNAYFYRHPYNL